MFDSEITIDIIRVIEQLVAYRFKEFYRSLDPIVFQGKDGYQLAEVSMEELQRYYSYGCFLYAEGLPSELIGAENVNPYHNLATIGGWMAMQDIQYRGGQVLPGDNQYE